MEQNTIKGNILYKNQIKFFLKILYLLSYLCSYCKLQTSIVSHFIISNLIILFIFYNNHVFNKKNICFLFFI